MQRTRCLPTSSNSCHRWIWTCGDRPISGGRGIISIDPRGFFQALAKHLLTGRNSTPVEVVLRMLVVKRLYQYSYEDTERMVNDSLTLRQFCRLYLNDAPDNKTIMRWNNLLAAGNTGEVQCAHSRVGGASTRSRKGKKLAHGWHGSRGQYSSAQ